MHWAFKSICKNIWTYECIFFIPAFKTCFKPINVSHLYAHASPFKHMHTSSDLNNYDIKWFNSLLLYGLFKFENNFMTPLLAFYQWFSCRGKLVKVIEMFIYKSIPTHLTLTCLATK